MQKVPQQLISQAIQVIRNATHPNVSHDQVENVARQLQAIIDDDSEQTAEDIKQAFEVDESNDEDEGGDK